MRMPREWLAMLPGAVLPIALATLVAMPHLHDGDEPRDERCVECQARGEAPSDSPVGEGPEPGARESVAAPAPARPADAETGGAGARAPPA